MVFLLFENSINQILLLLYELFKISNCSLTITKLRSLGTVELRLMELDVLVNVPLTL